MPQPFLAGEIATTPSPGRSNQLPQGRFELGDGSPQRSEAEGIRR